MKSLALVFWKEAIHDLLKAQNIPLAYRFWAIIHGFNPVSAWFKKINSHNYRNYLTDYVYYSHAPYNNDVTATRLISKLKFRDTFISFGAYLPKYYAKINNGVVEYLDSWCDDIPREGLVAILELLKRENTLVLKRLSGRAGLGFMLLRHLDNDLYNINDDILSEAEVLKKLSSLKDYLITEFVRQCKEYDDVWGGTTHTLRVQTGNVLTGKAEVVFAFLRFGSSRVSYAVGHVTSPGIITSVIDLKAGIPLKIVTADEKGQFQEIVEHPDSKENMAFPVPHWNLIVNTCLKMHEQVSQLSWLGWDIIVTDSGFKIIEVNTFSALNGLEVWKGIKTDPRNKVWFSKLIKGR